MLNALLHPIILYHIINITKHKQSITMKCCWHWLLSHTDATPTLQTTILTQHCVNHTSHLLQEAVCPCHSCLADVAVHRLHCLPSAMALPVSCSRSSLLPSAFPAALPSSSSLPLAPVPYPTIIGTPCSTKTNNHSLQNVNTFY